MKSYAIVLFMVLTAMQALAQGPRLDWVDHISGSSIQVIKSIQVDKRGNSVIAGVFQGTCSINYGTRSEQLTSKGSFDIFVMSINKNGNLNWVYVVGGEYAQYLGGITSDGRGNVYVTGHISKDTDFMTVNGPVTLRATGFSSYLLKLTANGQALWVKQFEGMGFLENVESGNDSALYIGGYFLDTMDFDPAPLASETLYPQGGCDNFILKMNFDGEFKWVRAFGGEGCQAYLRSIAITLENEVVAIGSYTTDIEMDPSVDTVLLAGDSTQSTYILKLDQNGSLVWSKALKSRHGDCTGLDMDIDGNGNIAISGFFTDTVDLASNNSSGTHYMPGDGNSFVVSLLSNGSYKWSHVIGLSNTTVVLTIDFDEVGAIYASGVFNLSADFDPGPGEAYLSTDGTYDQDIFIWKLSDKGEFEWARSLGGPNKDGWGGFAAFYSDLGAYHLASVFQGIADLDPAKSTQVRSNSGLNNCIFIEKLTPCVQPDTTHVQLTGCGWVKWTNGKTYFESDSLIIPLEGYHGCDSLVSLSITLDSLNAQVENTGSVLRANEPGASYQWIDCNQSGHILNDTLRNFTPDVNGRYAVIVSKGNCIDTAECVAFTEASIKNSIPSVRTGIYPNPATDDLWVTWDHSMKEKVNFTLFDISGCTRLRTSLLEPGFVSVRNLTSGLYVAELVVGQSVMRDVLIIAK